MIRYNEGWNDIVNHALDDVGIKELKHEVICYPPEPEVGESFSAVDTDFVIFNNGFKVKYSEYLGYIYPEDDYGDLFQLPSKTLKKFFKEVKRLDAIKKECAQEKKKADLAEKSSFIKDWYVKRYGGGCSFSRETGID